MPTRPRGTSTRTPKAPPPVAGNALDDPGDRSQRESTRPKQSGQTPSGAEITGGSLERRDIPSFSDNREQRIAEAAYWRAERRGFKPGHELEDWLEAEREVDTQRGGDPTRNQRPDERTG
jgi:Protein of unknown function (DUF2934)